MLNVVERRFLSTQSGTGESLHHSSLSMVISPSAMTISEWQQRLCDTFTVNGLVGGNLQMVQQAEDAAGSHLVNTFHGQNILIDSFQSFFIETLTLANHGILLKGWPKDRINYAVVFAAFFNLFRRFRACEILYINGYPLDGYALMRDIKDRTFMLAGVARNFVTFAEIVGVPTAPVTGPAEYKRKGKKKRQDTEHRVMSEFIGKNSLLSIDVQEDLKRWNDCFHLEVHGGAFSLMQEVEELRQGRVLQIGPSIVKDAFVMYINRSSELGWMITRLLPLLQVSEGAFGEDWQHKQKVLDDAFRYMLEGFSSLGKRLGVSFITMMDTKLVFRQPFYYFEADGSGS